MVVPPVEPLPAVEDPPADMPKVSSLVAKVEDAIEESAAASTEATMPKMEAPAVDTPAIEVAPAAVETPSVETPAVEAEAPAVEVKAPEVPAVSEVSAEVRCSCRPCFLPLSGFGPFFCRFFKACDTRVKSCWAVGSQARTFLPPSPRCFFIVQYMRRFSARLHSVRWTCCFVSPRACGKGVAYVYFSMDYARRR